MAPYRVLVVDDSAFMRKIISDLIMQDPQFTIAATASNGQEAIDAVKEWKPDVVTIDLEMPVMNGLEALKLIMQSNPIPIIMLSGISEDNTRETIKALQYGAFDFIRKPSSAFSNDIHQVGELLLEKLRIAVLTKRQQPVITIRESLGGYSVTTASTKPSTTNHPLKPEEKPRVPLPVPMKDKKKNILPPAEAKQPKQLASPLHTKLKGTKLDTITESKKKPDVNTRKPILRELTAGQANMITQPPIVRNQKSRGHVTSFEHIVAIGTSTGGPRALHEVICSLPADFSAPVLIVQHMPPKFTKSLAQRLDSFSELQVVEAEQSERVSAGVVYLAPGGYHMELAKDTTGYKILLTEQPPQNGHRPSVDVLFESMTSFRELKRHVVIMTGMGSDGAKGMKLLLDSGVDSTIAEAEETCVVYGMPRSAIEAGLAHHILPLQHIAPHLVHAVLK